MHQGRNLVSFLDPPSSTGEGASRREWTQVELVEDRHEGMRAGD